MTPPKKRNVYEQFGSNHVFRMSSHARIDVLPSGVGIEEIRCSLLQRGYTIDILWKQHTALHLNGFEIQFHMHSRKVTVGVSDYETALRTRIIGCPHCYIRASPSILTEATSTICDLIQQMTGVLTWQRAGDIKRQALSSGDSSNQMRWLGEHRRSGNHHTHANRV